MVQCFPLFFALKTLIVSLTYEMICKIIRYYILTILQKKPKKAKTLEVALQMGRYSGKMSIAGRPNLGLDGWCVGATILHREKYIINTAILGLSLKS